MFENQKKGAWILDARYKTGTKIRLGFKFKSVDAALRDKGGCCPVYDFANLVAHGFAQKLVHSGTAAIGLL